MPAPDVTPIVDIMSLVLHTGMLPGRKPVSALLCSPSDNGKTTWIMDRFADNPSVARINFATRIGLAKFLLQKNRWRDYHHVMIPDMTTPLSGSGPSSQAFQSFLMGLVYEGITNFQSFNLQVIMPEPVRVGLIAGIVPSVLQDRRKDWAQSGFLRRFLPVSFDYTQAQDDSVRALILAGRNYTPRPISLNGHNISAVKVEEPLVSTLTPIVDNIVRSLYLTRSEMKGNTFAEMLHSLVLAHAARRGSAEATMADVAAVARLSQFMNYSMEKVPNLPIIEGIL